MTETAAHRPTAVLFDLDGTLVDTIELIIGSYRHAVSTVTGREPDEVESRDWIGRTLPSLLAERFGAQADEVERSYRAWNLENSERLVRPFPGITDLLTDLRAAGMLFGVVTSKRRDNAVRALGQVGLAGAIDVLAAMEDTATHKPEPEPLLFGASALGVRPADCTYVGDAAVDVLAAQASGMRSVAVGWGAGTEAALLAAAPDHFVADTAALRQVLLAGNGGDLCAQQAEPGNRTPRQA